MTLKIGVLGLVGSGKDTFANMLQEALSKLGHDFKIDRYARPIKELTSKIFNVPVAAIEVREIKEHPKLVCTASLTLACHTMLKYTLGFSTAEYTTAMQVVQDTWTTSDQYTRISPREFMQIFGTDVVRAVRPNAWVDILQERDENLIVPDVRFENELCDYNVLITGRIGIDKPKPTHSSEMYAWDLEHDWNTPLPKDHFDVVENVFVQGLDPLRVKALEQAVLIIKQL